MLHRLLLATMLCAALAPAAQLAAQDPILRPDTMPLADTIPREEPSPRAAFLRALAVPGLGHFYLGERTRGAVYVALQSTSFFMLGKTLVRLGRVQDRVDLLTGLAADSLAAAMAADTALARVLQDPVRYEEALFTYPGLQPARSLASARRQQRQDWITYTLFFTFAAAVDAYVTAHLKDFPADLSTQPATDGGLSLGVRVPVGGGR